MERGTPRCSPLGHPATMIRRSHLYCRSADVHPGYRKASPVRQFASLAVRLECASRACCTPEVIDSIRQRPTKYRDPARSRRLFRIDLCQPGNEVIVSRSVNRLVTPIACRKSGISWLRPARAITTYREPITTRRAPLTAFAGLISRALIAAHIFAPQSDIDASSLISMANGGLG